MKSLCKFVTHTLSPVYGFRDIHVLRPIVRFDIVTLVRRVVVLEQHYESRKESKADNYVQWKARTITHALDVLGP